MENQQIIDEIFLRNPQLKESDRPRINSFVNQIKEKVLAYTHLEELPQGLFYVIVSMVEELAGIREIAQSIKEGDASITYARNAEDIVLSFKPELNKYRRMAR
ncbi:hypothetical protein [Petroclostridium xylanilyticum]|uniref:hypothetical protein n=1 Tax=Petroclostridium xylanilyticum TaxID=1792311 RepID=UPI000B993395|nr:hypothetical protein [Petroclostridium xylanilyticum]